MSVAVLAGLFVFAAGLGSFLSPCVLPLVPGYLSMLSGVGVDQLREGESGTSKLLAPALAFVIGLSAVFITMGATASAVGHFLLQHRNLLAPIAGALIILFGLHLIGLLTKISVRVGLIVGVVLVAIGLFLNFRTGASASAVIKPVHLYATSLIFLFGPPLTRWLNRDVHMRDVGGKSPGIVSGFLLGFAFALGWTPCIGPILTTVLAIAAARGSVRDGIILLTLYSAGLSIPFLLTAIGVGRFMKFYQKFRRHLHTVEVCSGVLLLLIGALIFTNGLTMVSSHLNGGSLDVLLVKIMPANVRHFLDQGTNPGATVNADANLQPEPNVTFKNLEGGEVQLSSLKGKVVLLNFWATWCEPCRGEIPILIGLQDKYASKGFTMLGASMDDDGAKAVDPFLQNKFNVDGKEQTMDYPIVLGSDAITDQFGGLLGMPTSYLISRDGKIVKKYIGVVNEPQITKDIESQL
jgi:cytochrome c-type biogenesis protein